MRRAAFASMYCVGSKSLISQANLVTCSDVSKSVIGTAADFPSSTAPQTVSRPVPNGVTSPSPVMTTRRLSVTPTVLLLYMERPPSIGSTAPVIYDADGEHRNATADATSAGTPSRASGVDDRSAVRWSSVRSAVMSVTM